MPNRVRMAPVSRPIRVVAPISVNGGSGIVIVRACIPASNVTSTLKSSIALYRYSSTTAGSRWTSSMNSTSPRSSFVRMPTRSAGLVRAGPVVTWTRAFTSLAITWASVVLPSPGGPSSRTWATGSPRPAAAVTAIRSRRISFGWPMYWSNVCGRRA